jgi:mycofactocin glycosyltransferase
MTFAPGTNYAVTVIIPSYRSVRTLERCLEGVSAQRTSIRYRIVVMHSGDEPIEARVLSRFAEVEFRVFPDQLLPAVKRNWAARDADTPWLLFLDSDCVPCSSWLETMLAAAEIDVVNAIGGSVDIARPWGLTSWIMHLLEFGEWLPAAAAGPCRDFPSCNALYQRELFIAAGGFPETFLPCEDTILNAQLRARGCQLAFIPDAVVEHIHCRNTMEVLRHNYNFGLSYGLAARRYGLRGKRLSRSMLFVPLVVAGRLVRMIVRVTRYRPRWEATLLVAGFPLIVACLIRWSVGFVRASREVAG